LRNNFSFFDIFLDSFARINFLELMRFTWDDNKRESNLDKHGLDFDYAEKILNASKVYIFIDNRYDYGEERRLAYSIVDGVKLCLCFVHRIDEIRVISIRRVPDREWRKHYGDSDE